MNAEGYIALYMPGHPRALSTGYVLEHIVIAERALGKPLAKKHPIHHVDENGENNANDNLVVCENHAYHELLHQRTRALLECGNASAIRCGRCGGYDNQAQVVVRFRRSGQRQTRTAAHSSSRFCRARSEALAS